jgi:adenine/guanine phosphoribosyltransferase-like PRPP-binding protein
MEYKIEIPEEIKDGEWDVISSIKEVGPPIGYEVTYEREIQVKITFRKKATLSQETETPS